MGLKATRRGIGIGILVQDIARSLDFYVKLLGLEKVGEMPTPHGRLHRLAYGDSDVKLIDAKAAPAPGPIGLAKAIGFRYLTFDVANLDELCAACEAAQVPFEVTKRELVPGLRLAMIRDPDGNVVELVQRG